MLEALEVNVRCSAGDGIGEQRIDELYDWRFLDGDGKRRRRHVLFDLLDELDVGIAELRDVLEQILHLRFVRLVAALDGVADGVLAGDYGKDIAAGHELEVVEDTRAGWVSHGDRESATVALEGEHEVFRRHLAWNEARDAGIDLEVCEVDGGHSVLPRERACELDFLYKSERNEAVSNARAGLSLILESEVELVTRNEPLPNEDLTDSFGTGCWCCQM